MYEQATPGNQDTFRDHISTISEKGNRAWIYPKKPAGKLYRARTLISYLFLAVLFAGPFMTWNGHPFVLFNVIQRKFILFGVGFWPQDFFLFVLAMLTFIVFIILFTAIFGRVWCGWVCPQTVFMEMVFRKIEYWIEGDAAQQRALDAAPWSEKKALKKIFKHALFFLLAFVIANTFLAYIIGFDQLKLLAIDGPGAHMVGFVALLAFTGVFYGVYARFREQVCLVVCPYGRLQGVLLDRNTVVIAYDYGRGEPRGPVRKKETRTSGDCVDCHLCVQVCPTGIDIRNGTQLECVNCSACIDACNHVMDKVGFSRGLIRYTSENTIASKQKFRITTRIIGYSAVLLLLVAVLSTLLAFRTDVETTILRTRGQLYQDMGNGQTGNLYNIDVVNKTYHDLPLELRVKNMKGTIKYVGNDLSRVKLDSIATAEFFLVVDNGELKGMKTPVVFEVCSDGQVLEEIKTNFLGPVE
jgi:cytochrome c oxidase accessory protein FixG